MLSNKQYNIIHFFDLCNKYKELAEKLSNVPNPYNKEIQEKFIRVSLELHQLKGKVPKKLWGAASLNNRSREKWG